MASVPSAAARCPVHHGDARDFDPFDLRDPFPAYRQLRAEQPVFFHDEIGYWVVSRFEDIKAVFGDWKTFSAENAQQPVRPLCEAAKEVQRAGGFTAYSGLSARVPPEHTRIRKGVMQAFTPRRYKVLEPTIRARVNAMLDAMLTKPEGDLIADLAYELPALTIMTLLGIPDEDVDKVKLWGDSRVLMTWGNLSDEEQVAHAHNLVAYWNYCQALVASRHEKMQDDLPGDLVRIQESGEPISDHEIASFCYSLLTAGHETTTTLIGNGLRELLVHRDEWEKIVGDQSLIPGAMEEILRFSPSVMAWRRRVKAPTQIGGVDIPEGANLLLLLGSANRDETVFEAPEAFDIGRTNARQHLAFGYGIHYCPGNLLAKLQLQIVIEETTQRIPTLRVKPDQAFEFARNTSFRAPKALMVQW